MSLARNVGKIIGKGMKVSADDIGKGIKVTAGNIGKGMKTTYQSADDVYTKIGQSAYLAGRKAQSAASQAARNTTIVSDTKNALHTIGRGVKYSASKADDLVDKGLDNIGVGASFVGSKIADSAMGQDLKLRERSHLFVDKLDDDGNIIKSWDNLYTGKKLSPIYSGIGSVGVVAIASAQYESGKFMAPITASKQNVEQGGPPEVMLYDGVGQHSVPNHLNATGNLVFGLHNQRKG